MAVDSSIDNSDFKITLSQVCNWGLPEEPNELLESFQPHIYGLGVEPRSAVDAVLCGTFHKFKSCC